MVNSCSTTTIVLLGLDPDKDDTPTLSDCQTYQNVVGLLLNIPKRTRPDIAYAATFLRWLTQQSTVRIRKCAKHVFRYLKSIPGTGHFFSKGNPCSVLWYHDSDWGQDSAEQK